MLQIGGKFLACNRFDLRGTWLMTFSEGGIQKCRIDLKMSTKIKLGISDRLVPSKLCNSLVPAHQRLNKIFRIQRSTKSSAFLSLFVIHFDRKSIGGDGIPLTCKKSSRIKQISCEKHEIWDQNFPKGH